MYDLVWVICPWCVISCSWCCCQKASPLFSFTCLGNDFQYNWFAIKNMIILHRTLSLFFFFCCITYRNSIRRLSLNKLVFPISSILYCFWNYLDKRYISNFTCFNLLTFLIFRSSKTTSSMASKWHCIEYVIGSLLWVYRNIKCNFRKPWSFRQRSIVDLWGFE